MKAGRGIKVAIVCQSSSFSPKYPSSPMVKRIAKAQVDTKPAVKVDRAKKLAAQKTADPSDPEAPIGESNQ